MPIAIKIVLFAPHLICGDDDTHCLPPISLRIRQTAIGSICDKFTLALRAARLSSSFCAKNNEPITRCVCVPAVYYFPYSTLYLLLHIYFSFKTFYRCSSLWGAARVSTSVYERASARGRPMRNSKRIATHSNTHIARYIYLIKLRSFVRAVVRPSACPCACVCAQKIVTNKIYSFCLLLHSFKRWIYFNRNLVQPTAVATHNRRQQTIPMQCQTHAARPSSILCTLINRKETNCTRIEIQKYSKVETLIEGEKSLL